MNLGTRFILALEEKGLFEDGDHRARFGDLVECYSGYPFFNAGLCKCMYLGSWDAEHFCEILDILNAMTLDQVGDTAQMEDNGRTQEARLTGRDLAAYRMCGAFLKGENPDYHKEDFDEETVYILEQTLKAAAVIDEVIDR